MMTQTRPRVALALACALAAPSIACDDPPEDPEPDAGSALVVTLGTVHGDGLGFFPLEGDQPLVPGSQGGFHVWIKYRVDGHTAGTVRIRRTARRVSDERLVLTTQGAQALGPPGPEGYWELPEALPSFMCPSPIGVNVIGEPIRFTVEILDEDGGATLGTGSAVATPRCPAGAQEAWCLRICSG